MIWVEEKGAQDITKGEHEYEFGAMRETLDWRDEGC
jgi:hypothetical protein